MFFGTWNQGNNQAFKLWEEDEKRRKKVVADPQKSVATGKVSFREASVITNNRTTTENFRSTSGNEKTKSYDWEKKYLYDLPRSYGRSYNDKFEAYARRELGMGAGEAQEFRKYLDAKEKGKLNDWGMNDMLETAMSKAKGKVEENNSPVVPAERTRLDRVFDTLLAGNYFSANLANNLTNKKESFLDAIKHAGRSTVRASNPFGDGSIKDEMTYSKVFDNAGWKPKSGLGKFTRGATGFVADVLLDPTTYMTAGVGAFMKGAGKASISGSKLLQGAETIEGISDASKALMKKGTMSKEVADKIVQERASRTGKVLSAEELTQQSEKFQTRFHELVGTNRKNVGMGVGLKHSPLNPLLKVISGGNKTVNKLADFHVELPGSRQALETLSKVTQADRVYAGARKMIYGTQMSKLFSTKAGLHKLASQDPARIYDFMHMVEKSQGVAKDKLASQKAIMDYANQNLKDLSPADMKQIVDALQDKTLMAPIKRMVALGSMKEAKQVQDRLALEQNSALEQLGKIAERKNELDEFRNANINEIDDGHRALKQLEDDHLEALRSLELSHISDKEARANAVSTLVKQADELNAKFKGMNTPLKPELKNYPDMETPMKPIRPYNRKPIQEPLAGIPEKPKYPDAPKREDFEKKFVHPVTGKEMPLSETHQKAFQTIEDWKKGAGKPRKPADVDKVINELSEAIYGETGKISLVTYPFAIDNLVKMVENGSNPAFIKQYINANKHQFDGRARDMYDLVAHHFKYGQDKAYKYKSWDEYYTQRIREIESRAGKDGQLSPGDWNQYQKLQKDNLDRSVMLNKMMEMTPRELQRYRTQYFNDEMWAGVNKLGNGVNFEGSFEWKQKKDGSFYGKHEADKIAGRSEEDVLDESRKKWNDEDYEGTLGKESRVGTSSRQDFEEYIDENGKMQTRSFQDGIPSDKKERTFKLQSDDEDFLRGQLAREVTEDGKKKLTNAQYNYIGSVMEHVEPLLKDFFKKDYTELSEAQRTFLVGMAKQHALTGVRGGVNQADKIIAKKLAKEAEERQALYEEMIHAETVKAQAKIGSPIKFNQGEKSFNGKIIGVNREEVHTRPVKNEETTTLARGEGTRTEYDVPEYITTYNIQDKDGNIYKSVKPADVEMVNRMKPARILQDNSYKSAVDAEFQKAMAEHELLIKSMDEQYAKDVEEVKARNVDVEKTNAERKAKYEKDKADAKAKYEESMKDYEVKRNFMDDTMEGIDALNKASKDDWAKASMESSKMAEDYIRQSDLIMDDLDRIGKEAGSAEGKHKELMERVRAEFEDSKKSKLSNIADLEKHGDMLDREIAKLDSTMINGRTYDQTLTRIEELRNAFSSDDAWEDFLELNYADSIEKWDRANGNKNVGKIVLDTQDDMNNKVKRLVLELRGKFNDIAKQEVLAGRLKQGQVDGMLNEYLTHVATDDGKKFFKDYTLGVDEAGNTIVKERPKKDRQPSVTQDLGFGEVFNQFGMERKIKKLKMPDGTWVERPTIEQINEVMRPYIKGGNNAFSENIADIYLARALKHNDLMFDETYMSEMMRTFGDDISADYKPRKGFKAVMNYGLFKRNVEDMAKLKNSLAMEKEILQRKLEAFRAGGKFDVEEFIAQRGAGDYDRYVQEGYDILGFDRNTYRTEGMPLLELTPEQVQKVNAWHQGTLDELKGKYQKWFDDAEINRANGYEPGQRATEQLMKYNDILESLTPLEIKEMHETITGKMNQSRKIAIAKNQNRLLGAYDKFTHWMKLSQTAMLPSFHTRNFLSNQFQNYLAIGNDVFDIDMQKRVMKVLRSAGDTKKLSAMQPLIVKNANGETTGVAHWNDIILEAQARGILDDGFFATELGANDKSAGFIKGLQDVKIGKKNLNLDPTSTENSLAKLGTNVGSKVEGHAKLMQFASHIKNGKSFDEAQDLVNKYLFDYSDLTHFEQNVMKRIFPYYTWLRKNAKLQITQMVEQPGKYRDTAKGINAIESGVDEEDRVETQYLAPFAKDWIQYGGVDKDGKVGIVNPNMPFQDISRLPNPFDLKQSMEALIPQTNVLPKEILQQATNHDFFFNDKIQKEEQGIGKRLWHAGSNYAPALQIHDLIAKEDKGRQALSTSGLKTLKYDYKTAKDITIAKFLGKYKDKEPATITKKFMDKLEGKDAVTLTQASASRLLDDYINGEDIGKTKAGIFTPFAKVMKEVGLDKAKNREWVSATLDSTHLEKYLTGSDFETAKVTGVRDGDTIEVELNGKKEAVRFNLIDTPEIGHTKGAKDMPFGDEAHKNMSRLAGKGKDVRLVISKDKDAHGRLVAYVYVDGKDLNEEQLESGNAQLRYVNASENPYRYDKYKQAQTRAYDKKKGIWSIDGYADNEKGSGYNKRGAYKKYLDKKGR